MTITMSIYVYIAIKSQGSAIRVDKLIHSERLSIDDNMTIAQIKEYMVEEFNSFEALNPKLSTLISRVTTQFKVTV